MNTFQGTEFEGKDPDGVLTSRQLECLVWAAEGKENGAIALLIGRSPAVAKKHLELAMVKLGASNRTLAVARAFSAGLLTARTLIIWLCIASSLLSAVDEKKVLRPRTRTGRELREGRMGGKRREDRFIASYQEMPI